ncbi:LysR family transcriptional regulator [Variovorax sp. H27-G14]|uniref:LysR family transcriptional regulator n=1 Tax=Variovorax sp. H27-G14 TaxID=3111914 RepID=UPI0038FCA4D5
MNTRQLKHFLAVMDLGTLSAAAEHVHLSLPAISRSLSALENALGVPLFDRQGRRLRPTAYADAYVERARRIVFDEKEGARSLSLMRAGELGALSFGMGSSIARSLLGPMMLQLVAESPGLRLSAMVQSSDVLFDALVKERLDFFVGDVRMAAREPDLVAEAAYVSTFGWFARAGHPLAGRKRIGMPELSAYPMVMAGYADQSVMRRIAETYGLSMPLEDHFAMNTDDVGTIHTLVTSSDAIAPSTDIAVISALSAGTMVALDVEPRLDLDMTLGIVRRAGRTLLPAAERAFDIVRAYFADAAQQIAQQRGHGSATKTAAGRRGHPR